MSEVKQFNELVDAMIGLQNTAALKAKIDLKRELIDLIQNQVEAGLTPIAILTNLVTELGKATK